MKKLVLYAVMIGLLALFVSACGGGDSDDAAPADAGSASIDVTMHDIYYGDSNDNAANPPTWTVATGGVVTVNAENVGALDHNWAIVEAGATLPDTVTDVAAIEDIITYDVGVVAAGDSYSGAFNAPAPGEYTIICTVAGHYPAMQGKLIVEDN